jgi:hypothetical protein
VRWLHGVEEALPLITPGHVHYADEDRYHEIIARAPKPIEVIRFDDYRVQLLSLDFILPASRASTLRAHYLIVY